MDIHEQLKKLSDKIARTEELIKKHKELGIDKEVILAKIEAKKKQQEIARELKKNEEAKKELKDALGVIIDNDIVADTDAEKEELRLRKKYEDEHKQPSHTLNELRHKKYKEVNEEREDISGEVKKIVNKLQNEGKYKLALYQGKAGGSRKLLKCPHCEGIMLAAGIRLRRDQDPGKPPSENQRNWLEYITAVGMIPDYKGLSRAKVMKAASELRGKGYSIDDIKELY